MLNSNSTQSTVSIYDMKEILKKKKLIDEGEAVNLSDMAEGVYLVTIENGGQVYRKKILL